MYYGTHLTSIDKIVTVNLFKYRGNALQPYRSGYKMLPLQKTMGLWVDMANYGVGGELLPYEMRFSYSEKNITA